MSGSVYGNVVEAGTGEPVAGATVVCGKGRASEAARAPSMSAMTDSAGWFRFENLPAGEWWLRTRGSQGYRPPEATVSVFDNALSEATLEIVSPTQPDLSNRSHQSNRPVSGGPRSAARGNVRGRVIDTATGAPIGYAAVIVVSGPGPAPNHVFVANSAGWFELDDTPVGDWLLRARSDAGATGLATVRVAANALSELTIAIDRLPAIDDWPTSGIEPDFDNQEPAMNKGCLIGHVVRADDGRPVAEATVTILRGAGSAPDIAPITDRNGSFALDWLPAGSWLLRAIGPNGGTGLVQVSVQPDSITDAVIKLTFNGGNSP